MGYNVTLSGFINLKFAKFSLTQGITTSFYLSFDYLFSLWALLPKYFFFCSWKLMFTDKQLGTRHLVWHCWLLSAILSLMYKFSLMF
jgi:hypothetical protein